MTDRVMLRTCANGDTVSIQTYSARMKSPHRFYICFEEFDRLQQEGRIITCDIRSFARIWLKERNDLVKFQFAWLSDSGLGRVEGVEQKITLGWSGFLSFLQDCRRPDGPRTYKALSLDTSKRRPRLVFAGSGENLRSAVGNPRVRHKLSKALMAHFNWPDAEEIRLYNDLEPYSFFFQEIRDGQTCMCGGLILHSREAPRRMAYSIHT